MDESEEEELAITDPLAVWQQTRMRQYKDDPETLNMEQQLKKEKEAQMKRVVNANFRDMIMSQCKASDQY